MVAEIVFGAGASHSPQVSTPPELWPVRGELDRERGSLSFHGKRWSFDELRAERAGEDLASQIDADRQRERYESCQGAIRKLGEDLLGANLDVLIIIGDDQDEQLQRDNRPAIMVYAGDVVPVRPRRYPASAEPVDTAAGWSFGEESVDLPGSPELAEHLVRSMVASSIDVAYSDRLPRERGIGHAFAFVYRRLCEMAAIPSIPIMLNTYFPPNQPTARRCVEIGHALRRGLASFGPAARVGVVASGGLSHFVIDEEFDAQFLRAATAYDTETLAGLPETYLEDGTSEMKNWIVAAAALGDLTAETLAYEPCYRSLAGTGCAMAYTRWT